MGGWVNILSFFTNIPNRLFIRFEIWLLNLYSWFIILHALNQDKRNYSFATGTLEDEKKSYPDDHKNIFLTKIWRLVYMWYMTFLRITFLLVVLARVVPLVTYVLIIVDIIRQGFIQHVRMRMLSRLSQNAMRQERKMFLFAPGHCAENKAIFCWSQIACSFFFSK